MEREESIRDDATSKQTLEDLEENEEFDESDDSTLPSPDGAFDEAKEQSDADPM